MGDQLAEYRAAMQRKFQQQRDAERLRDAEHARREQERKRQAEREQRIAERERLRAEEQRRAEAEEAEARFWEDSEEIGEPMELAENEEENDDHDEVEPTDLQLTNASTRDTRRAFNVEQQQRRYRSPATMNTSPAISTEENAVRARLAQAALARLERERRSSNRTESMAAPAIHIESLKELCLRLVCAKIDDERIRLKLRLAPEDLSSVVLTRLVREKRFDTKTAKAFLGGAVKDLSLDHYALMTNELLYCITRYFNHAWRLSCSGSPYLTELGIKELREMPKLRHLNLAKCKVTDKCVRYVASITTLEQLDISDTKVTDAAVPLLTTLTNLNALSLGNNAISDTGIAALTTLCRLRFLSLDHTRFMGNETSLKAFTDMPQLTALNVSNTPLSTKGLAVITPILASRLRTLDLRNTAIDSAGCLLIAHFTGLTQLGLPPRNAVRDIAFLSRLTGLTELDMADYNLVTEVNPIHMLTNLSLLSLANTKVTDEGARGIEQLRGLTSLNMDRTKITDAFATEVLPHLQQLRELSLSSTAITNAAIPFLLGLECLGSLNLSRNRGITDEGATLLTQMRLGVLNLVGTEITQATVAAFSGHPTVLRYRIVEQTPAMQ